jgi:hypothetical protein
LREELRLHATLPYRIRDRAQARNSSSSRNNVLA